MFKMTGAPPKWVISCSSTKSNNNFGLKARMQTTVPATAAIVQA
jgi:hypothetical protein